MKTSDHKATRITSAGRSAFKDLFSAEEAAELEIRATLLRGLQDWLTDSGKTQAVIARQLNITQARVSDLKRGKINSFSLDLLVKLAARAGLQPRVELAA